MEDQHLQTAVQQREEGEDEEGRGLAHELVHEASERGTWPQGGDYFRLDGDVAFDDENDNDDDENDYDNDDQKDKRTDNDTESEAAEGETHCIPSLFVVWVTFRQHTHPW